MLLCTKTNETLVHDNSSVIQLLPVFYFVITLLANIKLEEEEEEEM